MTAIDRNTQVELVGRGVLTLRPNDHVATGGEGSVYRIADTIIKIYTDEKKMQREGIVDKVSLLSPLRSERIIAPEGIVTIKGVPRGFYMTAADGDPLALFFTNDFRREKNFTDKDSSLLVDRMREVFTFAHGHKAILGDANEMNWFAIPHKKNGPEPRAIDVDSWAIGRFPVCAVMPSIRDWHTAGFTELSDWFGFGVVTFQVYTGIHPYKGTLDGFSRGDLIGRMKANASVFAPGVRLNNAVRDFSCIPGLLLEWYRATFQQGERAMPPSPFDAGVSLAPAARVLRAVTTSATGLLVYEKIFGETNDTAIKIFSCGIALLQSGKLVDLSSKRVVGVTSTSDCEVIKVDGGWVKSEGRGHSVQFAYIKENTLYEEKLSSSLRGFSVVRYADRLFVSTEQGLTELIFMLLGGKAVLSSGQTWGVLSKSTQWFDGIGIQDTMGAMYLVLPFGASACAHVRAKELDGMRSVNARAGNRFASVVAIDKNGTYHKFEFTFDNDYRSYKMWRGISDGPEINLAILPKGVCATIVEDGALDIFVPSSGMHNKIKDKQVTTDMALAHWGDKVVYIHNGNIWSVRMK